MKELAYFRPRSLEEAWRLKETHRDARFIAGGTDLQIRNWKREADPSPLISLRRLDELNGIESGDITRIGALTPVSDIAAHEDLAARYPALGEAACRLGSTQIRNVATIGGNLCRAAPCADLAPPLLVHEATIRIESRTGAREVAMEEFMRGPGETCLAAGEVVTSITMEPPPAGAVATFRKKGRVAMDLSLASVAVLLVMEGARCAFARVAAGSVAPTPLRLREVEALLEGEAITPAVLAEAQRVASATIAPITDVRTTAEYRRQIVGVFVKRAVLELMDRSGA